MASPAPDELLAYRDGIYASDLLISAVSHFDFFSLMTESALTAAELGRASGIAERPLDVMLTLFLARGLVRRQGATFALTDAARRYLVRGSEHSLVPYYSSLATRPQSLEFREVLTRDRPAAWASDDGARDWLESMQDAGFADSFTAAMNSRGAFLADRLAERLDCSRSRSLLDIGGGSGIYACRLAERHPELRVSVLEIPPIDRAAARSIAACGMSGRVRVEAGDMFTEVPVGHDLHLFANVFHDWDLDSVRRLCARSYESLEPGGKTVVFDAHLNDRKDGPLPVAEYSCLIMHSTPGRCYSSVEVGAALRSAGFDSIAVSPVDAARSLVTGTKTSATGC